jgi:hypothetical protein
MKNQRGQIVVEAVLLTTVLLGLTIFVQNRLQQSRFAEKLVSGPWGKLSGMIECGVWDTCVAASGKHPSNKNRNLTFVPEGQD